MQQIFISASQQIKDETKMKTNSNNENVASEPENPKLDISTG